MRLLCYKDLNTRRVKPLFAKLRACIEANDFRSPDLKKLTPTPYWRFKLDYSHRLLVQFARYGDETVCLALEVIENHAYEKSRFLQGVTIDEAKIDQSPLLAEQDPLQHGPGKALSDAQTLRWLHPKRAEFELLDKPIVFDDTQHALRDLPTPLVVVGSAGSGKTAVTLSKLREADGRVLYVTQSAYLAQSAQSLYTAFGYNNPAQEVDFLSFRDFVETLRVPAGKEITFSAFSVWFERQRATLRTALGPQHSIDAHALFEEFRGVLSADAQGPLSLADYLALGQRQSLIAAEWRSQVYPLYQRYRQWMVESQLHDLSLVAYEWKALATPVYDFVLVDEVQDLTNVQLALALACLAKPGQFLLCGDSNQIVHPNFFSWTAVRNLFWRGLAGEAAQHQEIQVLQANFRNTQAVTGLANTLLKIKQARFGSVDRESNFLVTCASNDPGEVLLVDAKEATVKQLNERTSGSVQHAVVVLRDEDKALARSQWRTPLIFSVHEAKGLEYPHVILFNVISSARQPFAELCEGVTTEHLTVETLTYRRAKDKGDKSLELYKFYVNALYVAMTRAVQTLTIVEADIAHPLHALMGLELGEMKAGLAPIQKSSKEQWAQEARKLILQGKQEQAKAIQDTFLKTQATPWTPWSETLIRDFLPKALDIKHPSGKPRQALFEYALWHSQHYWIEQLADTVRYPQAKTLVQEDFMANNSVQAQSLVYKAIFSLRQRQQQNYSAHNFKDILRQCDLYGIDHATPNGCTPLMMAACAGNVPLVDALLARGANPQHTDDYGHTAWLAVMSRVMEANPAEQSDRSKMTSATFYALFQRLAPQSIDVQTDSRLIRLTPRLGEYWVLTLMQAGLKTLVSMFIQRAGNRFDSHQGFTAQVLEEALLRLPESLWPATRRKRSYINAVLARAAVGSAYLPSRQLWWRSKQGYYLPNPGMSVRKLDGDNQETWQLFYDRLNLPWIEAGTNQAYLFKWDPHANPNRLTITHALSHFRQP